ncbi:rRNA maturation RNase YbeY [Bacteroidota bacterium]
MEINVLVDPAFEKDLEADWLLGIARYALTAQGTDANAEMGLAITNQQTIQELNRDYLGKDEPTDVLAFYMLPKAGEGVAEDTPFVPPPDGMLHLGEVIISYPQALIQAEEHHHSVKQEIAILTIHGVLHLLGYDHAEPEQQSQMSAEAAAILSSIQDTI